MHFHLGLQKFGCEMDADIALEMPYNVALASSWVLVQCDRETIFVDEGGVFLQMLGECTQSFAFLLKLSLLLDLLARLLPSAVRLEPD